MWVTYEKSTLSKSLLKLFLPLKFSLNGISKKLKWEKLTFSVKMQDESLALRVLFKAFDETKMNF